MLIKSDKNPLEAILSIIAMYKKNRPSHKYRDTLFFENFAIKTINIELIIKSNSNTAHFKAIGTCTIKHSTLKIQTQNILKAHCFMLNAV